MHIETCLNCPYLQLAKLNEETSKVKYNGTCTASHSKWLAWVKTLFDLCHDGSIEFTGYNDKCISKLEHTVLNDEKEFTENGFEVMDDIFNKFIEKSMKNGTTLYSEGGSLHIKRVFNEKNDAYEWGY